MANCTWHNMSTNIIAASTDVTALQPFLDVLRVTSADFTSTGCGMACTERVDEGDVLLAISLENCWTADAAQAHPALAALGTEVLSAITPQNLIALHILLVRAGCAPDAGAPAPERCRYEHLKLLAKTPIEALWDWSEQELQQCLAGSKWALAPMWARQDTLADLEEWRHYAPLAELFEANGIDAAHFLWAHKVINSRMMVFTRDGVDDVHVIGPGADMFNHSADVPLESAGGMGLERTPAAAAGEEGSGATQLVVRASQAYTPGEQALFLYAGVSNGRLLMSGGFVLEDNPWDSVELAFTLPLHSTAISVYGALTEALERGVHSGGAFAEAMPAEFVQPVEGGDGAPPSAFVLHVRLASVTMRPQLTRVIRFFCAEQLGRAAGEAGAVADVSLEQLDSALTVRATAVARLRGGLREMLSKYPQTLAQNTSALAALGTPSSAEESEAEATARRRRHDALVVVSGEQRILQNAIESLDAEMAKPPERSHTGAGAA